MNILKCNILELQVLNQTKTWLRNPDDMQSVTTQTYLFISVLFFNRHLSLLLVIPYLNQKQGQISP